MKLNGQLKRAIRNDGMGSCAYILRDGIVVKTSKAIYHKKRQVANVETAHVQRGEVSIHARKYNGDNSSLVNIGGVGSHDSKVLLDGVSSVEVALNNSSPASKIAGVHVDTYTLETHNGGRHQADIMSGIMSGNYFLIDFPETVDAFLLKWLPDAIVEEESTNKPA